MNDTALAHAFAGATPVAQPQITKVTSTRTGLRFWWSDSTELVGRRFTAEVSDGTVFLRECGEGEGVRTIARNKQTELSFYKLGSPEPFYFETRVKPTFTNGRLEYAVPLEGRSTPRAQAKAKAKAEPSSPARSRTWTDRSIRSVLANVREIEATTSWRLSHDGKSGLAIFLARLE